MCTGRAPRGGSMRPPVPGWPQSVPRSAGLPEQSGSSRSGCPVVSCLSPSTLSFCFVYAGRPLAGARLSMTVPCCRALAPRPQEMDVFSEILIPTPVVSDSLGLCLRAVPSSPPPHSHCVFACHAVACVLPRTSWPRPAEASRPHAGGREHSTVPSEQLSPGTL